MIMIMEEEKALPKDIHMEILSWLPAKSLLSRFKLVCKAWRNLIHDPGFVKMHLSRVGGGAINGDGGRLSKSLMQKQPGTVLYQLHPPFNCDDHLPLDLEHISSSSAGATKLDFDFDFEKLSLDFDFDFDFDFDSDFLETSDSSLVGSCNGLLCLSINYDDNIFLLNPSTRKYKVSPKQLIHCPSDFTYDEDVTFGFGSIDVDDEYKVVRIARFYPINKDDHRSSQFQIDIYSMSSNSWRRWRGDIPFQDIHDTQFGLFLNGSVHWMASQLLYGPDCDMIVSFNIIEEKFGLVPIPPAVASVLAAFVVVNGLSNYPFVANCISLMNVRGCLGNVYLKHHPQNIDIDLEIWVMKEYGIKESWTKEFVIRTLDSEPSRELYRFSRRGPWSMTCSLAGDQIIIDARRSFAHEFPDMAEMRLRGYNMADMRLRRYGRRVLYDINKKKIDGEVIMEVDSLDVQDQVDYIETLVSLKSSRQLPPLSNNRKRKNCS